jgi:hypothetical protein
MHLRSAICALPLLLTSAGVAFEPGSTFPLDKVPSLTYLVDYEAAWSPDSQSIVLKEHFVWQTTRRNKPCSV